MTLKVAIIVNIDPCRKMFSAAVSRLKPPSEKVLGLTPKTNPGPSVGNRFNTDLQPTVSAPPSLGSVSVKPLHYCLMFR